ncbi:hypothetical protein [Bradyrhizobium sp. CCGB20]|uniref:hypothetical protein n=1 Tax=Bradyrhizobium sp. CCGB20 TaxID=2949633 RepID=UPI0020B35C3B|nr:hypothetical protein [Bradyrhizobium sp. CCGB20]MCP3399918.1 hypothetical protein [Bradyrhizobium sp. CCGB20]
MDRSTKILLGVIAASLWANALVPSLRPAPAHAQGSDPYLQRIDEKLERILQGMAIIGNGTCVNRKICGT